MGKDKSYREGLEYFPLDINYFDDSKILKAEQKYGGEGSMIATRLLCEIYKNGYFLKWNEDEALVFTTRRAGNLISFEKVNSIVDDLIHEFGFFSESMYKKFGVLTSKGIQERWLSIMIQAKRKARINPELDLTIIPSELKSLEEKVESLEETLKTSEESEQRKVKESKIKGNGFSYVYSEDSYPDGKTAFEEIKTDERFVEQLTRIARNSGYITYTDLQVVKAVKHFITLEEAKPDFVRKPRDEIKKHLVNWINSNAKKIADYG